MSLLLCREPDFLGRNRLRRRDFEAWAGERRSSYRKYGQAFRRTHDAKDPGPSGCVPAGARGVAALDRIADTLFTRLLADRLAGTQRRLLPPQKIRL
jgi:hypothetical protein